MEARPAPVVKRQFAVFTAALLLYLLLPTRNYYWDGLGAALDIENAARGLERLFVHPNHLLYQPLGFVLHAWTGVRALTILQTLNAVLGAGAVALMYRLGGNVGWAAVFALSATWWKFASDADAYVPAVFFLVAAYAAALRGRGALSGLLHAAAMLFHQLSIFAAPALLLLLRRRGLPFAAAAFPPVFAAYAWAYWGRDWQPPAPFLAWVASHSSDSAYSFDVVRGVFLSLRGTLRLFFGGKLSAVFAASVVGGWASARARLQPRPLLLWLATYAIFLVFWLPQNTFYRLFYLPPLILLAARYFPGEKATILAAVLAAWNLPFFILPHARVENNRPLAFALAQQARWKPGTLILYDFPNNDIRTLAYFNPQARWVWTRYWDGKMAPETWVERTAAEGIDVDREQHVGYDGVVFYKARGTPALGRR